MALVYAFPGVVTWLPDYLYGTVDTSIPLEMDKPVEGGPISGHLHAMRRRLQPPTIQRRTWL